MSDSGKLTNLVKCARIPVHCTASAALLFPRSSLYHDIMITKWRHVDITRCETDRKPGHVLPLGLGLTIKNVGTRLMVTACNKQEPLSDCSQLKVLRAAAHRILVLFFLSRKCASACESRLGCRMHAVPICRPYLPKPVAEETFCLSRHLATAYVF